MNMKSFAALLLTTAIAVPASAQEDNLGSLQRMQQLELQQLQQFALPQETKTRDQLAIYAMCTVPGRIIKVIFEDPSSFCGPNLYLRPYHYLDPLRLKLNICDGEKVFRLRGNLLIGDNVRIINNLFSIAIEIDEKLKHGLSMDEKFQYDVMLRDSENIWAGHATKNISFEAYFAEISDKCSEYKLLGKL